jgi:hypothetical protein
MGPHSNYTFWLHYYTKFLRIVPYRTPSILVVFLKIVPHHTPSLQDVFLENPDPGAYFEGPVFGSVHWHQWHLLHRVLHFFRWTRNPYMFLLRDVVQFGMAAHHLQRSAFSYWPKPNPKPLRKVSRCAK